MQRKEKIDRIMTLISRWVAEVRANNAEGINDINKYSEDIARLPLNPVYKLNLQNLEYIQKNYPAVDLGDFKKGIAFQVTSRGDAAKIQKDLRTFKNHGLKEQFPGGMRFHQQWQDFNLLQLQKLEDKQIEDYLQSRGIPRPGVQSHDVDIFEMEHK